MTTMTIIITIMLTFVPFLILASSTITQSTPAILPIVQSESKCANNTGSTTIRFNWRPWIISCLIKSWC